MLRSWDITKTRFESNHFVCATLFSEVPKLLITVKFQVSCLIISSLAIAGIVFSHRIGSVQTIFITIIVLTCFTGIVILKRLMSNPTLEEEVTFYQNCKFPHGKNESTIIIFLVLERAVSTKASQKIYKTRLLGLNSIKPTILLPVCKSPPNLSKWQICLRMAQFWAGKNLTFVDRFSNPIFLLFRARTTKEQLMKVSQLKKQKLRERGRIAMYQLVRSEYIHHC